MIEQTNTNTRIGGASPLGGIEYKFLPSWVIGASAEFSIVGRVRMLNNTQESGGDPANIFRTLVALQSATNKSVYLRMSDNSLQCKTAPGSTPPITLTNGSAQELIPAHDEWLYFSLYVNKTGTNLVIEAFALSETNDDPSDARAGVSLATTSGGPWLSSALDLTGGTLYIARDYPFIGAGPVAGLMDSVAIVNYRVDADDLKLALDAKTPIPHALETGSWQGVDHDGIIFFPLGPLSNPSGRSGGSGVVGKFLGDTLDAAEDVIAMHQYTGAADSGQIGKYDTTTVVQDPDSAPEVLGFQFVHPYKGISV